MPRSWSYVLAGALLALAATCAPSQELLDQIAARVESDIILRSEVRTLSRYQMLADGKSESDPAILDRLIDQWIVRNEANTARFPHPADAEIVQGVEHLQASFASPEEFQARKKQSGLSDKDIQRMVAEQLYLSASREYIQEALVQRGINEQAEVWLKESRARLHVEKFLKESGK